MSDLWVPGSARASGSAVPQVSRRRLLQGMMGAAGVAALGGLAACGDRTAAPGEVVATNGNGIATGATGTVTFGSNASDTVPREALAATLEAFEAQTDIDVAINTVDHNTFQEQINSYLQGRPDDVFTWFAGFRMQFFAERGLATPISDVWEDIGDRFTGAFLDASTGHDGEQYFIPFYYYPWAVFFRQSVFEDGGYEPAANLDEFKALCEQMQGDGLTPLAFADQGGWEAMGTFDYLNLRINGFDYHMALMAGEENWEDERCHEVFSTWRDLLPYHQEGALGRPWQEAGQALAQGDAGMYLLGMFVAQQFSEEDREDLDFFAFPEINPEFGQDSVEAPIDGFMLSKDPQNPEASKELLAYLSTAEAQKIYLDIDPSNIAAASDADTSAYTQLQLKAVDLINSADHIAQFLDRDTRPDFASTVMIPSLQTFINNPDDIDGLLTSIEQQKQAIFVD